jgi:hypothetical protein
VWSFVALAAKRWKISSPKSKNRDAEHRVAQKILLLQWLTETWNTASKHSWLSKNRREFSTRGSNGGGPDSAMDVIGVLQRNDLDAHAERRIKVGGNISMSKGKEKTGRRKTHRIVQPAL